MKRKTLKEKRKADKEEIERLREESRVEKERSLAMAGVIELVVEESESESESEEETSAKRSKPE